MGDALHADRFALERGFLERRERRRRFFPRRRRCQPSVRRRGKLDRRPCRPAAPFRAFGAACGGRHAGCRLGAVALSSIAVTGSTLGPGSRGACQHADRGLATVVGDPHCAAPARLENGGRPDRQAACALCRSLCRRALAPSRSGARPRRRAARPHRRTAGLSQPALSASSRSSRRRPSSPAPAG